MASWQCNQTTRADAGFTLIEVIVALALLSLMAALLAGIVNGSRQMLGFLERNDAANSVEPVQSYLRSAVSQTVILVDPAGGLSRSASVVGLKGEPDHIVFATSYSLRGQYEGLYQIDIGLTRTAGGQQGLDLVASQTLVRGDGSDVQFPVAVQRSTLLANVAGVSFAYFGRRDAAIDDWEWQTDWPYSDRLPSIVRIDVRFASGDPRTWHRLQVPLQMSK